MTTWGASPGRRSFSCRGSGWRPGVQPNGNRVDAGNPPKRRGIHSLTTSRNVGNWLITLQGTNISPKNGILKLIFLFLKWDMLISWRVILYNRWPLWGFFRMFFWKMSLANQFKEARKYIMTFIFTWHCSLAFVWHVVDIGPLILSGSVLVSQASNMYRIFEVHFPFLTNSVNI